MTDNEKEFENFVASIKFDDSPDPNHRDKLEQNLLRALSKQTRQKQLPLTTWRTIMKSNITKLATAAAIIILGLFFLIGDGQETLYAQVVKALEQARTIHAVIKEHRNGQLFKEQEMWYDRDAGIIEEERYKGRTDVRIDNGQYEWRYAAGNELAAQLNSWRDIDEMARDLCAEWLRFDPNRVPSGDMVMDGVPCEMYALSSAGVKVSIWVDGKNRVRQVEQSREFRGQKTESYANIKYDIAIDQNRFSPKFGSNVKLVNPRQLIEEQFPLDTAIFTRKCLGFVFAVHKLERCEGGLKYLVCSNRLSDETRQEVDTGHPWTYYGQSDLFGRWQSVAENGYSDYPVQLARMEHGGIQVGWYVLLPAGNKAKQAGGCDVDVIVNTANQLEEKCKAEGLPTHEKFRLNILVQKSQAQQVSLREIVSQIYSLGEKLDPIVHSFLLAQVITKTDGEKIQAWRRPVVELSEEEYTEDVERRVEEWLERNR